MINTLPNTNNTPNKPQKAPKISIKDSTSRMRKVSVQSDNDYILS